MYHRLEILGVFINTRLFCFFIAFFCAALIGAALYFQHFQNLMPCPMCMFQRVFVVAFGILLFIKALHHPLATSWSQWVYYSLGTLIAATGAGIAMRHVYLKGLPPDQVPTCGGSLDYMMDIMPVFEVITKVLRGSSSCADDDGWYFLGLNMPEWMSVIFVGLLIGSLFGFWATFRARQRVQLQSR